MIEVTQRNEKGVIQILAQYETEEDFGKAYWPPDIANSFSVKSNDVMYTEKFYNEWNMYITYPVFKRVAYNSKGKVLDVGHLVGLARKYNNRYVRLIERRNRYWRCGFKPHHYHRYRRMRTTQERRWANAWDDEEFAPKVRARRNVRNLPNCWDDYWKHREQNWKSFRKTQWK